MWLVAAQKPALEETLFRFLLTARGNRPLATTALAAAGATLREVYNAPHPDLRKVFGHCLNALLVEIDCDMTGRSETNVPASVFGLALAVNNCLAPHAPEQLGAGADEASLFDKFTRALVATLPVARGLNAALAYHAVLRGSTDAIARVSTERAALLRALIERSPLTALWSLDAHLPAALETLAFELLPGWQVTGRSSDYGWPSDDEWLKRVASLLNNESIARWARRRWLTMPETRAACRNVGLLLEALRRRGGHRAFILDFYEAYDYFRARTRPGEWQGQERFWPVLVETEKLLRVAGDSDAVLHINRRGNEYFLKFRALIETVIAENGIPTDYAHLSREFIQSLRPLLAYTTAGARQRLSFGTVAFEQAGGAS
ncbi:MAG: hypothetical protein QOF02_3689 [Blastocatellia bacterium]|jgi:hypothetical protein|nr:hypothetical protein [Blastocatellia bacterium]